MYLFLAYYTHFLARENELKLDTAFVVRVDGLTVVAVRLLIGTEDRGTTVTELAALELEVSSDTTAAVEFVVLDAALALRGANRDTALRIRNVEGCAGSTLEPGSVADQASIAAAGAGGNDLKVAPIGLRGVVTTTAAAAAAVTLGEVSEAIGAGGGANGVDVVKLTVGNAALELEEVPDLVDRVVAVAAEVNLLVISVAFERISEFGD